MAAVGGWRIRASEADTDGNANTIPAKADTDGNANTIPAKANADGNANTIPAKANADGGVNPRCYQSAGEVIVSVR